MLVSRLSEDHGREELQTRFETHIYSQGVSAVEKCGESAQNVSDCEQGRGGGGEGGGLVDTGCEEGEGGREGVKE